MQFIQIRFLLLRLETAVGTCNKTEFNFLVLLTGAPCKINISLHVLSMVPIKEIDMVSLSSTFNQDTETMSLFCLSR